MTNFLSIEVRNLGRLIDFQMFEPFQSVPNANKKKIMNPSISANASTVQSSAPAAPPPTRNVWAERQTFVQGAMPSDATEEEAMLRAALEVSRLEAEAMEVNRK